MARTAAEIIAIVHNLTPFLSLEDGSFVGVEYLNLLTSACFFVVLNHNGDVIIKTPLPEMVSKGPGLRGMINMARLEDGRIAIALENELVICKLTGEIQSLERIQDHRPSYPRTSFTGLISLINGNMLVQKRVIDQNRFQQTYGYKICEYTSEGECVEIHVIPDCARFRSPLLQLENTDIVMNEGVSIKILRCDLKTEVATLTFQDAHTNLLINRQLHAKTCWKDGAGEPLLAVAFAEFDTDYRAQINVYEQDTYCQIDSFRLDDSIDAPGLEVRYITDFNFSESLKHAGYTLAQPRMQCGPLW